ncbi:MarR family transcriptional regulator [Paenibacillus sp. TRM 82003]|nr:MarR family transcriptional regulator [Paenibacillus sp. TRM 82003]
MDNERANIGYLLNKSANLLKWELGTRLEPFDLTVPQWALLRDLYAQEAMSESERRVTPAHVAERLHADRPTVSGIVDRLSKKDLLRAEPNPADRRSVLLRLTDEARALMPRLYDSSRESLDASLEGLSPEQIELLQATLGKIVMNLEQRYAGKAE